MVLICVVGGQATLSLVMDLLLSDDHASPELGQITGRLVNAIVAVLGPELSPGSSLFSRCKVVIGLHFAFQKCRFNSAMFASGLGFRV